MRRKVLRALRVQEGLFARPPPNGWLSLQCRRSLSPHVQRPLEDEDGGCAGGGRQGGVEMQERGGVQGSLGFRRIAWRTLLVTQSSPRGELVSHQQLIVQLHKEELPAMSQ